MKNTTIGIFIIICLLLLNPNSFSQDEKENTKKYSLKANLTKNLEFTKNAKIVIKNSGKYQFKGRNEASSTSISSNQELRYKILEVKDNVISELKIEFLEQTRKSDKSNDYTDKKYELLKKLVNEWVIIRYSEAGFEILEKSDKIAEILKSYDQKDFSQNSDATILHNYLNYELIVQPIVPTVDPKKEVSVGDTWEIDVTDFLDSPYMHFYKKASKTESNDETKDNETKNDSDILKFKLEKVETKDETEIATISFTQTVESSDKYDMPDGSVEKYESKSVFNGTILFDLKKKLIISMTTEVVSTSVSYKDDIAFGNASFSSKSETTFDYVE